MFRCVIVFLSCIFFVVRSGFAAEVALFTNTSYVDYFPGDSSAEASNLKALLDAEGHLVNAFTTTSFGVSTAPTNCSEVLVIPELEKGNLSAVYSTSEYSAIQNFVDDGGVLVVFGDGNGHSVLLLNTAFGFGLTAAFSSDSLAISPAGAAATPFEGGPATIPGNDAAYYIPFASLPPSARPIYQSGTTAGVFAVPRGNGWVVYLGWDWFDAAPTGSADGGWLNVFDRTLKLAPRLEPDIYENDDTFTSARVLEVGFDFSSPCQLHTLHNAGDEDWVQFYRDDYVDSYSFSIEHHGGPGNIVLELFDTDGITLLCSVSASAFGYSGFGDAFGSDSECLDDFDETAIYFLRVRAEEPLTGPGPSYALQGSYDGAFESKVYGKVVDDVTKSPLEVVTVQAVPQGGSSAYKLSDRNGNYRIDLFPMENPYRLSVQKEGYVTQNIRFRAPPFDGIEIDVALEPLLQPGILVMPTGGLLTTESGGTAEFTVVLNKQPTADVVIGLSSSDAGEGQVTPRSLTITPSDWNTAQTVTITGQDDGIIDGAQAYMIVTAAASSGDAAYDGINASDVSVANQDNDAAPRPADTDGDGLPDDYEIAQGFNPRDAADAKLDADGDGATNLAEFRARTDPHDPASVPRYLPRYLPWIPILLDE